MKLNTVRCDRCGFEQQAGGTCTPREVLVCVHRTGEHPKLSRTPDLCERCFNHLCSEVIVAIEPVPKEARK